ncbi:MAG: hypothetical protein ACTHLT_18895 [Devosia sp.]
MSRTFYPSDAYDSRDLEREASRKAKRDWRHWLAHRQDDEDDNDDPPPAPVASRCPIPVPSLTEAKAA